MTDKPTFEESRAWLRERAKYNLSESDRHVLNLLSTLDAASSSVPAPLREIDTAFRTMEARVKEQPIESECCRENVVEFEPCGPFLDLQHDNEKLASQLSAANARIKELEASQAILASEFVECGAKLDTANALIAELEGGAVPRDQPRL